MQRRTRVRLTKALLLAALITSTPMGVADAQQPGAWGPPPGGARGPGRRPPPFDDVLERNAGRLGLDERTRSEVRGIADAAREESRGIEAGLRPLHDEMRKLLDQEAPDLDGVLRQADRIGAAETELSKLRLRTMLRIRGLLTPEQRQELVRIHEERRRERGRGDPPGPPPPPGPAPDGL